MSLSYGLLHYWIHSDLFFPMDWVNEEMIHFYCWILKHKSPRSRFPSGVGFHSSPSPSLYLCANVLFPLTSKLHQNCYLAKVILLPWKSRCFSISVTIIYLSCVISERSPHLFSLFLNFLILIHQAILLGYSGPFWSNFSLKISFT